jgi:hypothetical protein
VGHAPKSGGLLHLKAIRARVLQSGLKTAEIATTGGAHDIIVEIVLREN